MNTFDDSARIEYSSFTEEILALEDNKDHYYQNIKGLCWVDGREANNLHSHHVVPVSIGTKKSPRVMICSSCHAGIHDAEIKRMDAETYSNFPNCKTVWDPKSYKRADYLISVIVDSKEFINQFPDEKKTRLFIELTGAERKKLKYLQNHLNISRQDTAIKYLINNFHL